LYNIIYLLIKVCSIFLFQLNSEKSNHKKIATGYLPRRSKKRPTSPSAAIMHPSKVPQTQSSNLVQCLLFYVSVGVTTGTTTGATTGALTIPVYCLPV